MKRFLGFRLFVGSLILLLLFVATASTIIARPVAEVNDETLTHADEFVARVYYNQIEDIQKLMQYDVWEYNNLEEKYVLVAMNEDIYQKLSQEGWRVLIDEEATSLFHSSTQTRTFNGGYRTVTEIHNDLNSINAAHPTLTEVIIYGDSYCLMQGGCTTPGGQFSPGYNLKAMRITNEAIAGPKPIFFLMANIHAREITTPELAMRFINWLVDGYGVDADATWLVDYHEVYVIPIVNPDGHWIVELGPYYQRKNANRSNGCTNQWPPSSSVQYGIDLNRNHSFHWNNGGTSTNPCDQTYLGPSAASEPEVYQLQNYILSLIPDQRGPGINDPAPDNTTGIFITLHSYSELVLWPWGDTTAAAPNKTGLQAIGNKFATYNGYTSCQPSVCLYATSGTSDDWAYGELGVPAFTFEVGTAFMPTYSTIDSVQWPENRPAFIYAAKIARTPYMLVKGPDTLGLTASANGYNLNIAASINDSSNGGQVIAGATYYIDTPPWAGGTNSGSLNATDGSFNSSIESVNRTVDVSSLADGQHVLYVQGQDNQGNLGPFTAVFFTLPGTSGNTGFLSPTANAAQTTSSGDNNGFQTSPTNAYANDSLFAVDTNSGTSNSTSCTSTAKDKHRYYNYNISLPGTVIDGIEVRLDGRVDATNGSPRFCVQLSWDGGITWTTAKTTANLTTSETTYILGGTADNWGRTWSVSELSNTNFRLRVIPIASSTQRDFSLDWVSVQVTYH